MWVFLGLSFIPILPLVGWGFLIIFIAVLVMIIRWQVTFSGVITNDPDYEKARRTKNLALILWLVALPTGFIVRPLVYMLLGGLLK
jgi:cytosine/uracil/thiamine/allantoin permease